MLRGSGLRSGGRGPQLPLGSVVVAIAHEQPTASIEPFILVLLAQVDCLLHGGHDVYGGFSDARPFFLYQLPR